MAIRANPLWCADYKGEFMLADRRYCYPLTITDFAGRYLISCDAGVTHVGRRVLIRRDDLLHWLDQSRAPSPKEH